MVIITMAIIFIFFNKKYKKYGWLLIKIIVVLSFIPIILLFINWNNFNDALESKFFLIEITMVVLSVLLYIFYITYRENKGLRMQKKYFHFIYIFSDSNFFIQYKYAIFRYNFTLFTINNHVFYFTIT